ncbi:hypothetical protein [Legionella bononiensis]|uniref:hypothetical protein n=1 Tax=Legionella bononiensis TaxID=2793102 RepID=UPI001933C2A6|nr:hypothetical protein [Legionella bononiensis]MBL7480787.1 hypothetical protein [Legionella bononiensis]
MAHSDFIKRNGILILGLALPILVMAFFFLASIMPLHVANPPLYDMIFTVQDYSSNSQPPVTANFVVIDGTLKVQYIKNRNNVYNGWKKLYLYEAKSQKVRQLSLALPKDIDTIQDMKEETVDATKHLKLDTSLESPDGYLLSSQGNTNNSGLLGSLLWGGSYSNEACLKKGSTCIKLQGSDSQMYFYPGYLQFIGWVKS